MRRYLKLGIIVLIGVALVVGGITTYNNNKGQNIKDTQKDMSLSEIELKIRDIMREPGMQQRFYEEATIEYWQRQVQKGREKLRELNGKGFSSEEKQAEALKEYLESKGAHEMAVHAREIVELYRWADVVAIVSKETNFCQAGVGSSRNNCGAIKNGETLEFKHYSNIYDSLWDVAYLLQKPHFKGKSLADMNGTYCVWEEMGGGECPGWTEHVEKTADELSELALNAMIE